MLILMLVWPRKHHLYLLLDDHNNGDNMIFSTINIIGLAVPGTINDGVGGFFTLFSLTCQEMTYELSLAPIEIV